MRIGGNLIESLNNSTSKATDKAENTNLFNEIFSNKQINITASTAASTTTSNVYSNLKSKARDNDKKREKYDDNSRDNQDTSVNKKDKVESKKTDKTSKSEDVNKVDKEDIEDEKLNEVYDKIANFLGINVEELKTLMNEKGIDPQSLTSLEGVRNAIIDLTGVSDVTELLNMDGIKDLFTSIDETLSTPDEVFAEKIMAALAETDNPEVVEENVISNEELLQAMNENINSEEVVNEVSETVTTATQETTPKTENITATNVNAEEVNVEEVNVTETDNVAEQVVATAEVADDNTTVTGHNNKVLEVMEEINQQQIAATQTTGSQTGGQSSTGQNAQGGSSQGNTQTTNNANTNENFMNNIMFSQDAKSQVTTFNSIVNSRMNQNVNQSEVINQLIEKMKVTVNGDTSEVRITLRPEHLGDVTLKIATHNGVVTAEFLAESEQVKALIEASFTDLQDTLRQQGIEVSDFTTGLLSDQSNGNEKNNDNRKQRKANGLNGDIEVEEVVEEVQEIKISNYDYRA